MIALKFSLKEYELEQEMKPLIEKFTKTHALLKEIGLYLLGSIEKNFRVGGRPIRWKPSKRALKQGSLATGNIGQTLVDTARLKNSIAMKILGTKTLSIGTNVKYARIHQEGGNINKTVSVKAHTRKIKQAFGKKISPKNIGIRQHLRKMNIKIIARPYLLIQDPEDWKMINRISEDYLAG